MQRELSKTCFMLIELWMYAGRLESTKEAKEIARTRDDRQE